jgi:Tol biopolymer transport system component
MAALVISAAPQALALEAAGEDQLAREVRGQGWIAYGARSDKGDWDLFLCRPDGSNARNLTQSPLFNEALPQFSRDGRRLLYRRMPRAEVINPNHCGEQGELVIANSDGTAPKVMGRISDYPWASWNPDGRQVACLSIKGITLFDLAGGQAVWSFARKGFFQQMTWSPDGRWLLGVANSYGTGWSIARLELATGEAGAVNRVDCCTPDWFPDSREVIFSWRPPGQKGNQGYGWTQLWRADREGRTRQLVYGEDGRHVYGGHVSPDGQYVLFTGNVREDGDPTRAGAPMGLMRLTDGPIIRGESAELRALHPKVNAGPVLTLPVGWEPCWTFSEAPAGATIGAVFSPSNEAVKKLADELRERGWIAYSAKTDQGNWDMWVMRPDGSARRKLTDTPEFNEAAPRFSPDGKRLLYYRPPKSEALDNNTYGTFDLVIADADGGHAVFYGRGFPWASWGPDGTQLACLKPGGIQIVDVATRQVVRQIPRQGIVQQLVWSPDGQAFVGTANGLGPFWNIGRLDAKSGEIRPVSETERYNCTPDWAPDSRHIVYARGIVPEVRGRAELWVASLDGTERQTLYAEEGRHIYGGCISPDGRYALFTRSVEDLGKVDNSRTTMAIIRRADTPMIGDESAGLRQRFPNATSGPRLDLGAGWEPHWTMGEMPVSK